MNDTVRLCIVAFQLVCMAVQIYFTFKVLKYNKVNRELLATVKKTNESTKSLLESITSAQANMPPVLSGMKIAGICAYCGEAKQVGVLTMRCDDCLEKPLPEDKQNPKYRSIDDPWEKK